MKHIKLFENFGKVTNFQDEFYYLVVDELVELGYGFDNAENLISKHRDVYDVNLFSQEHRDQSVAKTIAQSIEEAEMQDDDEDFNESLDSDTYPDDKHDENEYHDEDDIHHCDACKEVMSQGYVINGGEEYFCSNTCLNTKYDKEAFEELYDDGEGDSYWTEWTDEPTVRTTNQIEEGD